MWRQHYRMFVLAGLLKLVHDVVMFLGPFVLEQLLKYLQRGGTVCKSGLLLKGCHMLPSGPWEAYGGEALYDSHLLPS